MSLRTICGNHHKYFLKVFNVKYIIKNKHFFNCIMTISTQRWFVVWIAPKLSNSSPQNVPEERLLLTLMEQRSSSVHLAVPVSVKLPEWIWHKPCSLKVTVMCFDSGIEISLSPSLPWTISNSDRDGLSHSLCMFFQGASQQIHISAHLTFN